MEQYLKFLNRLVFQNNYIKVLWGRFQVGVKWTKVVRSWYSKRVGCFGELDEGVFETRERGLVGCGGDGKEGRGDVFYVLSLVEGYG